MKKIIISIGIICIFSIIVVIVYLNLFKKTDLGLVTQPNVNSNVPEQISQEQKFKKIFEQYGNKFQSIMQFLSFCDYNSGDKSLANSCNDIYHEYYMEGPDFSRFCFDNVAYLGMDYYVKKKNQVKFMQICKEYFDYNKADEYYYENVELVDTFKNGFDDCNLWWESNNFDNKEFCDYKGAGYLTSPILTDLKNNSCTNKINIKEVNLNELKSINLKNDLSFRRVVDKKDCLQISDNSTKLMCFDLFDNNICNEASTAVEILSDFTKLDDFIKKYEIGDCCYEY